MIYLSDIGYNFGGVAFPIPAGGDTLGIGAGVVNLGSPTFDSTMGLAPSVSAGDNAFSLSFAFRVKDIVAFGLTGKYILRSLAGYNASAFGGDAGVLITPTPQFRIGLGLFNLGSQVQFISEADPLPLTGRLGLSLKILDDPHDSLTLAVDNTYDLNASMYAGAAGMEFWLDNIFALRAGYTGDAYQQHWTAGTGFSLDAFELDYAYAPIGTVGDTHRISLIVRFGAEGENLAAPVGVTLTPGDSFISLHWKPAPSSAVSGYNVYVRKPNATGLIRVTKHPLAATESTVKLGHLANGQNYTVGIASVSPGGRESGLITLSAMPQAAPAAPLSAPTGLKAALDLAGFDLTWDNPSSGPTGPSGQGRPDIAGYNLYFADDLGKPGKKLNPQLMLDNKVTMKKADPLKTYHFLVTAQGPTGNESPTASLTVTYGDLKKAAAAMTPTVVITPAATATVAVTNAAPATAAAPVSPPAHMTMTVAEGKVHLAWDNVGAGMKYKVYVSKDGKEFRLLTPDPMSGTTATLGPMKSGQPYTFGVSAVTPDGRESEKALQVLSVTP
jgi:hypothetical protein